MHASPLAIGIDASTQGVKALALGPDGPEALAAVRFADDLPSFGAPEGFVPDPDPAVRRAPPAMWEEGVRLALERLGAEADLSRAACVAGSAQQHGLVLSTARGEPVAPLAPIWMDHSTGPECAALEARFGAALRARTGSAATERFTGPQARKAAREDPAAWARAERVHCIASWLNSRLVEGGDAPCDPGSASGQNLMDLAARAWDPEIAEFTVPGLAAKLPRIVPSDAVSGALAPAFAVGGLRAGTPVLVWSGDNPDSLLGMGCAAPGEAVASLGTSDTFFAALDAPRTDPDGFGNVFCTSAGGYMSLSCFTNGALARDRVRREAGVDWAGFDAALAATAPGGGGRLLLPWLSPESVPRVARAPQLCLRSPGRRDPRPLRGTGPRDAPPRRLDRLVLPPPRRHRRRLEVRGLPAHPRRCLPGARGAAQVLRNRRPRRGDARLVAPLGRTPTLPRHPPLPPRRTHGAGPRHGPRLRRRPLPLRRLRGRRGPSPLACIPPAPGPPVPGASPSATESESPFRRG